MFATKFSSIVMVIGLFCVSASFGEPIVLNKKCVDHKCPTAEGTPKDGFPAKCICDTTMDDTAIRFSCATDSKTCKTVAPTDTNSRCSGTCTEPGYTMVKCFVTHIPCEAIPDDEPPGGGN